MCVLSGSEVRVPIMQFFGFILDDSFTPPPPRYYLNMKKNVRYIEGEGETFNYVCHCLRGLTL